MAFINRTSKYLTRLAVWSPVILVYFEYGYTISTVKGRSMRPTFNPEENLLEEDVVILDKFNNLPREYKIGEVVTFRSPENPQKLLVKRITGVAGDFVSPIPRSKRSQPASQNLQPEPPTLVYIPQGHCWVQGDDSFHSNDSNTFGLIPVGLIDAKVRWIIYPFNRFGPVATKK